jgi:hypothetical protein
MLKLFVCMDKLQVQFQQLEVLKKKINYLEKKNLMTNPNKFEFIIEDFITETLIITSSTDKLFFNKNLNKKGIYLHFLHFYFLYYSGVKIKLDPKSIIREFDIALTKLFSYNLKMNVVKQSSPVLDILYKFLKFKTELCFIKDIIVLETLMDLFMTEHIQTGISLEKLYFDSALRSDNGIYLRFLRFYFFNYSFVDINLNKVTVLACFNKLLATKFSYNLQKNIVFSKKKEYDIFYRDLQFKKVNTF